MTERTRGILYLFVAVALYSIMPVLIRLLGRGMIPPASQVFLRYCVAFIAALSYFKWKKISLNVSLHQALNLVTLAVFGYALVNYFYTLANLQTQISTVLFLFNCSTVMGPLLGYLFLGERLSKQKIIAMGIGFLSIVLLFQPGPMVTWRSGAVCATLSAIGSSYYVIGRKKLGTIDSAIILLVNTLVGVVVVGTIAFIKETQFFTGGASVISLSTWLLTIVFGLDNFTAYLFMTRGFQLVTAGVGSMVMLTENVIGVIFAFLFFAEVPAAITLFGGTLIMIASLLVLFERKSAI